MYRWVFWLYRYRILWRTYKNINNKKDTYMVEGINADLRHHIPVLVRRNRCFSRSLETLKKVVEVFVFAYNKFVLNIE